VIFRPLHEANGLWFWWGVDDKTQKSASIELYRDLHSYLTEDRKLHNILWGYSPGKPWNAPRMRFYPGDDVIDIMGPTIYENTLLEEQIDAAIRHAAAFRPGHAFCHRCAAADCEHSVPPAPDQVFVAYGPTGTPTWMPLAGYCLEVRHPEVDRLYANPPAFVALVHDADALRGRLLDAWQNPVYELLGQLTAGYFRVPGPGPERQVLALTLQVTAASGRRGQWQLGLNVLGRSPDGEPLGLRWERQQEPPWRRAVLWAQAALTSVGAHGRRRAGRKEVEARVAGILNGLARRLERDQRGRSRRTGHAEQRHRSGDRPTRKALDAIRLADRSTVLVDERTGALVVLGERGRTHFFTPEGRLVSSVRYSRDAIERKRRQGLWRPAPHEEADALLRRLAADGA
jgi:hypothetical protein